MAETDRVFTFTEEHSNSLEVGVIIFKAKIYEHGGDNLSPMKDKEFNRCVILVKS